MQPDSPAAFICPACAASFSVTGSARAALIDHGCPLCGERVTATALE